MKKAFYLILAIAALCVGIVSCQKAPFITMTSPRSFTFSSQGGSQAITFTCNRSWSVSSSETWIRVTPSSGEASKDETTISLICEANTTYSPRSAMLKLTVEEITETIEIEQLQNDAILLKETKTHLPFEGGMVQIEVEANVEVEVSCSSDWVQQQSTKALSSMILKFSVAENNEYTERTARINIKQTNGTVSETYQIIQDARPPIDLSVSGTANCYMVPLTNDRYSFNASVKGNSTELLEGGETVDVLWEDDHNSLSTDEHIVREVQYNKETKTISFYPTRIEGSAVLALKNQEGTIIWSWHIWATSYVPENENIKYVSGAVLQNRYLGATSIGAGGYNYQWGRKDPLLRNTAWGSGRTVQESIEHPEYVFRNDFDWDWNNDHTSRWYTNKTNTDPCPPGWKVADGNPIFLKGWPADYGAEVSIDENASRYSVTIPTSICQPPDVFTSQVVFGLYDNDEKLFVWTNYGYTWMSKYYAARAFGVSKDDSDLGWYGTNKLNRYLHGTTPIIAAPVRCQKE